MKINKKKAGLAVGVAAAATVLVAPAAFAASTLSVDGSTAAGTVSVTGSLKTGTTITFTTNAGVVTTCTTANITGYVLRGASVTAGTKMGAITNLTFSGCVAAGSLPVVVEMDKKAGAPVEWPIHTVGNPAKGAASANIEIRNVWAKMHSTGAVPWTCAVKARAVSVPGTFHQSATNPQIRINSVPNRPLALTAHAGNVVKGAQLPAWPTGPATCAGSIYTGDTASMVGSFNLVTPGASPGGNIVF